MNKNHIFCFLLLFSGCSSQPPELKSFLSPERDQEVVLLHQSCGAGCNAKDVINIKFNGLDGQPTTEKIAEIRGASNIEVEWISSNRIILGGCNASSAQIKSDLLYLNQKKESSDIKILFSPYKMKLAGRTICQKTE